MAAGAHECMQDDADDVTGWITYGFNACSRVCLLLLQRECWPLSVSCTVISTWHWLCTVVQYTRILHCMHWPCLPRLGMTSQCISGWLNRSRVLTGSTCGPLVLRAMHAMPTFVHILVTTGEPQNCIMGIAGNAAQAQPSVSWLHSSR